MPTDNKSEIVIFKTTDEKISVDVRFEGETVWLTQAQLVDLYGSSKANVSEHIKHIFEEEELKEDSVVRNFRTTESLSSPLSSKMCLICSLTFDLLVWNRSQSCCWVNQTESPVNFTSIWVEPSSL